MNVVSVVIVLGPDCVYTEEVFVLECGVTARATDCEFSKLLFLVGYLQIQLCKV